MRRLLSHCLPALFLLSAPALAQDVWPSRPVKLIVPFAAGGNTDVVGRVTANFMQNALKGAPVVVENRPGGGGIAGTQAVTTSPPDGYTLCVCSIGSMSIALATIKITYDPVKDLAPISMLNTNALAVIVHPKLPINSVAELIALSKTKPEGLTYGSSGVGGLMYYSAEVFKAKTGAKVAHVPYRGGALATAGVVTGEIDLAFANLSDAMAQLGAKTVRAIAVTTGKRTPFLADLPTLQEAGIANFDIESWNALLAPAGTPRPIIDRLARIIAEMAKDEGVRKTMAEFGSVAVANTPEEFAQQIRREIDLWAAYSKEAGLAIK